MQSELLSAWGTVGSVLLAIFLLLVMITVHEFGHYLAGKALGFKIDEFSIGFGPALFKHRRKKTGELFALRLIPLGGYCAFHGEDGLDEEPDPFFNPPSKDDSEKIKQNGDENTNSSPALSEAANDTKIEENVEEKVEGTEGSPALLQFTDAPQSPPAQTREEGTFTEMPCWKRIIVLVAGAFMNYLLALLLIIIGFTAYGQTMIAVYQAEECAEGEEAYSLHDLDIFLKAEGKNLYLTADLAQALNGKKAGDFVTLRVSRAVGVQWTEKDGVLQPSYERREEQDVVIKLKEDVNVRNSADVDGVWAALGVKYEQPAGEEEGEYLLANAVYKFGFWEALGRSFVYSFKIAGSILKILGELLTGRLGLSAFGGPVTTITMTSQIVSRGFRYFLEIAGFIGVNLAVFNLLPVPALDGCKVVFTVIEWIRGKPVSRKVEAILNTVGFFLLLAFAILVDILQFV